jgi:hypothetical protein
MAEYFRAATLHDGKYHQTVSGDVKTEAVAEGDARDFQRRTRCDTVGVWRVAAPPGIPQLIKVIERGTGPKVEPGLPKLQPG